MPTETGRGVWEELDGAIMPGFCVMLNAYIFYALFLHVIVILAAWMYSADIPVKM